MWHQHDTPWPAIGGRRIDVNATDGVVNGAVIRSDGARCGRVVTNYGDMVPKQDIATLGLATNLHSTSVHNPRLGRVCGAQQPRACLLHVEIDCHVANGAYKVCRHSTS